MFKCSAFYRTLCPFCAIHNGFYTSVCKTAKKKNMETGTMLGSCCTHDRPDIDTYLAYLDMYTDSYIHIYIYTCIYIYIYLSIYICDLTCTHTHIYIYNIIYIYIYLSIYLPIYLSIYNIINSRQSEISRPTGQHIPHTAATVELSCKACFLTLLCGGLSSPDHPAPDPTPDPTPSLA